MTVKSRLVPIPMALSFFGCTRPPRPPRPPVTSNTFGGCFVGRNCFPINLAEEEGEAEYLATLAASVDGEDNCVHIAEAVSLDHERQRRQAERQATHYQLCQCGGDE